MYSETLMFVEMNNPNLKKLLSTHGYSCSWSKMQVSSATKCDTQLVKVEQLTSKSMVLRQMFAAAHLWYQDKSTYDVFDKTSNQVR